MTFRTAVPGPLRRLALVLAVVACVLAGAIVGALRELLRPILVALHSRLGRLLSTLALALLLAGCGAPRMMAHYAGPYQGESAPDLELRIQGSYHSTTPWGQRWTWSAMGAERLPHSPWWQVLDAEGLVLSSARGSAGVAILYPAGAAYLRVMLPARLTCFSYSPEGRRVWRVVYVRRIGTVQVAEKGGQT